MIVTWVKFGYSPVSETSGDIFGQLFDLELNKIDENFRVNDITNNSNRYPVVIENELDNSFWILYDEGNFNDGSNIYVHKYDLYERRMADKFILFDDKLKKYESIESAVKVSNNLFVITMWASSLPYSNYMDVYYSVFDFNGKNIVSPQIINDDYLSVAQVSSDLACDEFGNILIVWHDERDVKEQSHPYNFNIYGQFINSNFEKISNNFLVNDDIFKSDYNPDVTYINKSFVVSWTSLNQYRTVYFKNEWQLNKEKKGEMVSNVFDTQNYKNKYHKIYWAEKLDGSTSILFQLRSSNDLAKIENSKWFGPTKENDYYSQNEGELINPIHNTNRFIQYKAILSTESLGKSPKLNSVKISFEPLALPNNFELHQNYPNPFNSSTIISYSVGIEGHVKLNIYDSLGKELFELINEFQLPNQYKVVFDSEKVSSGVYYYRLQIDNQFEQTNKMVVLK